MASLYLPWLEVVLENQDRLAIVTPSTTVGASQLTHAPSVVDSQLGGSNSLISAASCPYPANKDSFGLSGVRHHR